MAASGWVSHLGAPFLERLRGIFGGGAIQQPLDVFNLD